MGAKQAETYHFCPQKGQAYKTLLPENYESKVLTDSKWAETVLNR